MAKVVMTSQEIEQMQSLIKHSQMVDLVEMMLEFDADRRAMMLKLFNKEQLADLFAELPVENKQHLIDSLAQADIPEVLSELDSDELVDSLQELPSNLVTKLLGHIPEERRQVINQLLNYPDDSVGSLMNADFIAIRQYETASELLSKLKQSPAGHEHLNTIFVIDDERHLLGYLYLADVLRLDTEEIDSIIQWNPLTVHTHDD